MKLAWTSDLHLVFLAPSPSEPEDSLTPWLERLAAEPFDALAISGDISEAPHLQRHLELLESHLRRPIYFVLGNHDYYRSSFDEVIPSVRQFTYDSAHLHCMDLLEFVDLTPTTALIGHGCWGDGGYGDFFGSQIMLNDWKAIKELRHWKRGPWRLACVEQCGACETDSMQWELTSKDLDRETMADQLRALGERAALHIRRVLPKALEAKPNVVLLTHAPPFAPRCVPTKIEWDWWAPHAGCKAAGDAIEEIMEDFPHRTLLILSGHVHKASCIQISRNIEQRTASARYGDPKIAEMIDLPVV